MARQNIDFNSFVPEDLTKSTIDWGTVATGLTKQLTDIKKDRDARRSGFEDSTYKKNRELRDLEKYDNTTLNQLVISASGSAQEYLGVRNDLFKNGLITETQYTKDMDRISGNFTDFNKAAKNYDASYKKYTDRIKGDPTKNYLGSSTLEQRFAEGGLAFGNLNGLTEYINPTTGEISLVRLDDEGNIPKDPSKHTSFSGMNNLLNFELDQFNLQNAQKTIVDNLGVTTTSDGTIGDATLFRETATAGLDKYVNGFMVKDLDVATVLEDTMGNGYYTTTDLTDDNPLAIHIDYSKNNQPTVIESDKWAEYEEVENENGRKVRKLIGGQKKVAEDYMRETMKDMIDNKEKAIRTSFESSDASTNRNDKKFESKEISGVVYTQQQNLGGSVRSGADFITDSLGKYIGGGGSAAGGDLEASTDTDVQIRDTFNDITREYLPPAVRKHFADKPLDVHYFDQTKTVDNGDGTFSIVQIDEDANSRLASDAFLGQKNNFATVKEANKFINDQSLNKRSGEFMEVDFGGISLVIPNMRSLRSEEVFRLIQTDLIDQAVNNYNDDMYFDVYGERRKNNNGGNGGKSR